jgi:hypothetical protein
MRNARETLDYYNRKFVVNVTGGIRDFDGVMEFNIPPPNETANSNNYNQCIIRIKEIIIANDTANLVDQVNPVFVQKNGGGLSSCMVGIIVRTSIPCRNSKSVSDNYLVANYGENHDQSFHQLVSPEARTTYIRSANVVSGRVATGSKLIMETPLVAAVGGIEHAIDDSVNFFYYQDGSSFEDSAVLCANPFGTTHNLTLRDAFNGTTLGGLASGFNLANGRNTTAISLKLEILMLPNPTPMDRV